MKNLSRDRLLFSLVSLLLGIHPKFPAALPPMDSALFYVNLPAASVERDSGIHPHEESIKFIDLASFSSVMSRFVSSLWLLSCHVSGSPCTFFLTYQAGIWAVYVEIWVSFLR